MDAPANTAINPVSPKNEGKKAPEGKVTATALIGHPDDGDVNYKEGEVLSADVFGENGLNRLISAGLAKRD